MLTNMDSASRTQTWITVCSAIVMMVNARIKKHSATRANILSVRSFIKIWCGSRESNPEPTGWKPDMQPITLDPHECE